MARKPNWRAIRIHRSYSVDEAARTLGVAKITIRRWIRYGDLSVIDACRPVLIQGAQLSAFGKNRKQAKHKCRLDQCFCMRCRKPKSAALSEAEVLQTKGESAMVRMLCETCATVMHKRVSWKQVPQLASLLTLSGAQGFKHLIETTSPCANDHKKKDA